MFGSSVFINSNDFANDSSHIRNAETSLDAAAEILHNLSLEVWPFWKGAAAEEFSVQLANVKGDIESYANSASHAFKLLHIVMEAYKHADNAGR